LAAVEQGMTGSAAKLRGETQSWYRSPNMNVVY
jgi:hypothetical protein